MKSKAADKRTDGANRVKEDQARAELVVLASEKLGRSLTQEEENEIQRLGGEYLTSGYYAALYSGYNAGKMLDWFSTAARIRKEFAEIQRQRDAITKEQLKQARTELVQIAAEKLGRALTHAEVQVVRGFDKSLVVNGDMAELFRGYSQQKLVNTFAEAGAGPGPVALLNSLATRRYTVEAGHEQILEVLSLKGRRVLQDFDFTPVLKLFSVWFLNLLRTEPPGNKTRALYFGLYETRSGCQLYVSGANAYDKEDSDWACTGDWAPEGRYAPIDMVSELWGKLKRAGDEPWVIAQAVATIVVRAFFENHHAEFKKLTGLTRVYIACGFDDGDLYVLRTPVSPGA